MAFYAVCDGGGFAGYEAATIEGALFQHVPDGGGPEPTTVTNPQGWWHKGMFEVYVIHNAVLQNILGEEDITDLRCEGEGDFVLGKDFEPVGRYRWNHEP